MKIGFLSSPTCSMKKTAKTLSFRNCQDCPAENNLTCLRPFKSTGVVLGSVHLERNFTKRNNCSLKALSNPEKLNLTTKNNNQKLSEAHKVSCAADDVLMHLPYLMLISLTPFEYPLATSDPNLFDS